MKNGEREVHRECISGNLIAAVDGIEMSCMIVEVDEEN